MATANDPVVKIKVNAPDGISYEGYISSELAEMIGSPGCDPQTKIEVYKAVIEQSKRDRNNNTLNDLDTPGPSIKDAEHEEMETSSRQSEKEQMEMADTITIHNWNDNEEKLLITIRGSMEEKFSGVKQHDTLWNDIVKMLKQENVFVTRLQVINKWKNLKRKFKEIVDSNNRTGNKPSKWKHFESFSELYGHKASTKPCVTVDTSRKNGPLISEPCAESSTSSISESSTTMSASGLPKFKKLKKKRQPKRAQGECYIHDWSH